MYAPVVVKSSLLRFPAQLDYYDGDDFVSGNSRQLSAETSHVFINPLTEHRDLSWKVYSSEYKVVATLIDAPSLVYVYTQCTFKILKSGNRAAWVRRRGYNFKSSPMFPRYTTWARNLSRSSKEEKFSLAKLTASSTQGYIRDNPKMRIFSPFVVLRTINKLASHRRRFYKMYQFKQLSYKIISQGGNNSSKPSVLQNLLSSKILTSNFFTKNGIRIVVDI